MNIDSPRDSEGYLFQPEDWDETLAAEIAKEEGIELNETYWSVLKFMRGYFQEHDIAPDVRHLIKHMATKDGCSKKEAKQLVFELFPYGYVKQACKIAGMKKPRAWSTG
jgi:TusE/DsrC/DsvC family sulfur relay protein